MYNLACTLCLYTPGAQETRSFAEKALAIIRIITLPNPVFSPPPTAKPRARAWRGTATRLLQRVRSPALSPTFVMSTVNPNSHRMLRRAHVPQDVPSWVREAAYVFAEAAPMPMGAGNRSPMRDLKGWLARLLAEDVLPRWVDASAKLCEVPERERRSHAEVFTRTVLRAVSERDHTRSQSVDTTLRRHCSTDPSKGLTFMKILNAMCAAFDFAGSTSRCERNASDLVTMSVAECWRSRFDCLIKAFNAVRVCVKNDHASKELITSITNKTWATTFAALLLNDVHKHCTVEPAVLFSSRCTYVLDGCAERRDLAHAIAEAVMCAAPHAMTLAKVSRSYFSPTVENDPICCAAMLMPHSRDFALTLADRAVGLDGTDALKGSRIPIEIHREIRLFSHVSRVAQNRDLVSRIMVAFAPVFKCYKPPLEWRPLEFEMETLHNLATNMHWIALTVLALVDEDEGHKHNNPVKYMEALKRYELSGGNGDVFGAIHAAKMLIEGVAGVPRDPIRAKRFLIYAAERNIRMAISLLADLYCGKGEPEVKTNEEEAARLYQIAVDQRCHRATFGLADLYRRGAGGLPKDEEKADELNRLGNAILAEKTRRYGHSSETGNRVRQIGPPDSDHSTTDSSSASSRSPSSSASSGIREVFSTIACQLGASPAAEESDVGQSSAQEVEQSPIMHLPSVDASGASDEDILTVPEATTQVSPEVWGYEPSALVTCATSLDDTFNLLQAEIPEIKYSQVSRLRTASEMDLGEIPEFAVPLKRVRYQAPEEAIGVGSYQL